MTSKGTRRGERSENVEIVQVMWKDRDGGDKFANARTLDISELGMRIEIPEPVQERSFVNLRCDKLKLSGTASVRSCQRKGNRYHVGLEFSVGMKWKPPEP
jgi:PilZ domain-containing protein